MPSVIDAISAIAAGLSPTPVRDKIPLLKGWEAGDMTEARAQAIRACWCDGIGIVCGAPSGNLECLDFDMGGAGLNPWTELVEAEAPGLLNRLPLEQTPSGGYHVPFRRPGPVPGNRKLASRLVDGKPKELIETRGTGGQFVTSPTDGYRWMQGGWNTIPTLTESEAETLIRAACALNEYVKPETVIGATRKNARLAGLKPGDDFNDRADPLPILERAGWQVCGGRGDDKIHLTRPGKTSGISASLLGGKVFYCFTSNGDPFDPGEGYSPFAVYAMLEHSGDFNAAAKHLYAKGYGDRVQPKEERKETLREEPEPTFQLRDWISSNVFVGEPRKRQYLVEGVFPMGQASLIAASGGVGKSYSCLNMLRDVANGYSTNILPPRHFGGTLRQKGTAIYIAAEDDEIEMHLRLNALGGPHHKLITVPFPSVEGGAPLFFKMDPITREPACTKAWMALVEQAKSFDDLAVIVIDPLQVFCALDLNMPEAAQFVCSRVTALAAETGAATVLTHHFRKDAADSPEEARQAVRGSAGLIDGVRAVVAMWTKSEGGARDKTGGGAICKALGEVYEPEKVVMASVVKANGKAVRGVTTFLRDDSGVLRDVSEKVRSLVGTPDELADLLVEAIAEAAMNGRPYKRTGEAAGLFSHRHEMPEPFWVMSRAKLEALCSELLAAKRLVQCQDAKSRNILDVPDGPFAAGNGQFINGALPAKEAEQEVAA